MTRTIKTVIRLISILCITVCGIILYYYNSLIDIDNVQDITTIIQERSKISYDVDYEIRQERNYTALFYQTKDSENHILILKNDSIFRSRYKYFDYSSTDNQYDIYRFLSYEKNHVVFITAVNIQYLNEYENGKNFYMVTKTNPITREQEIPFRINITNIPYYDLMVIDFESDINYNFQSGIYNESNNSFTDLASITS